MFRRWLSGFINRNKEKIKLLLKVCLITAVVVFIVHIIFLNIGQESSNTNQEKTIYKPQETIISGSNISNEQYQEDSNIVETFIENCNSGKINEAYDLLTESCKNNLYPTVDKFKDVYCKIIFSTPKEYSIQSWINDNNYTTYRVRYMENALATGDYDNAIKYQDYITVVDMKDEKKINISKFIGEEEIYKTTKTNELDILVTTKQIYLEYEIYTLEVTNKTENEILLDSLEDSSNNIKLISNKNIEYKVNESKLDSIKLTIQGNKTKKIQLEFIKFYDLNTKNDKIELGDIILDVKEYRKQEDDYQNRGKITISL